MKKAKKKKFQKYLRLKMNVLKFLCKIIHFSWHNDLQNSNGKKSNCSHIIGCIHPGAVFQKRYHLEVVNYSAAITHFHDRRQHLLLSLLINKWNDI